MRIFGSGPERLARICAVSVLIAASVVFIAGDQPATEAPPAAAIALRISACSGCP
jgi:hypothetical protein